MRERIPEYPRTPHLVGFESKMDSDDKTIDIPLPFTRAYIQEKVDGANSGVSWDEEGPLVRNRNHMLRKSFAARTPAKQQFTPIWNWLYAHEDGLKGIEKSYGSPVATYGEWLYARHSVPYDQLPDFFIGFDMLDIEQGKFISPRICMELASEAGIDWIDTSFHAPVDDKLIRTMLGLKSWYRDGDKEGIVIKTVDADNKFVTQSMKVVRSDFQRQIGKHWNKSEIVRNKLG